MGEKSEFQMQQEKESKSKHCKKRQAAILG